MRDLGEGWYAIGRYEQQKVKENTQVLRVKAQIASFQKPRITIYDKDSSILKMFKAEIVNGNSIMLDEVIEAGTTIGIEYYYWVYGDLNIAKTYYPLPRWSNKL